MRASVRARIQRALLLRRDVPVPLADPHMLDSAAVRTRIVRLVLGAALVAAIVLAFLAAPRSPGRRFLPASSTGIVVLDVSSSVRPETYYRIEQTLSTIAASQGRLGLVIFSDVAYEAFPPDTAASELRLLLRFFAPQTGTAPIGQADLPRSPWEQWFSAGTRVSSGLFLAAHLLDVQHAKKGAVMLISDLADDPSDLPALTSAVALFQLREVPLQIIALNPSLSNALFFRRLLGTDALFQLASLPTGAQARGKLAVTGTFPTTLFLLSALAVLLLALNEWWAAPLRFRGAHA